MLTNINYRVIIIIIFLSVFIGIVNNYISPFGIDFIREKKVLAAATDEELFSTSVEEDYQVKSVSSEKVFELFKNQSALFIDARDQWEFAEGHIPGAYNLPYYIFEDEFQKFSSTSKNKLLIIYCDDLECGMSKKLASELVKNGYQKVFIFEDGWKTWILNNFPVESGGVSAE